MKKRLEAELISIAHRVLKLKGKEDVVLLHLETQKLYQALSVLRFYEENFETLKNTISPDVLETKLEQALAESQPEPLVLETKEDLKPEIETTETPEIAVQDEKIYVGSVAVPDEEITEEPITETPPAEATIETLFELVTEEPKTSEKANPQIVIDDLLSQSYREPEFVKVEEVPAQIKQAAEVVFEKATPATPQTPPSHHEVLQVEEPFVERPLEAVKQDIAKEKQEYKTTSLNDKFNKTITLGLNDRIAFEKHLFGGSSEDLNRVLSQLNTFNTLTEAQNFIDDLVKPDYNNWQGKEEYADRFIELVSKKFI